MAWEGIGCFIDCCNDRPHRPPKPPEEMPEGTAGDPGAPGLSYAPIIPSYPLDIGERL